MVDRLASFTAQLTLPFLFLNVVTRTQVLARRIELDRAVSYVLLARAWAFVAGPVSGILIATQFTPTTQGFYYTFGSILALQAFAELGIGVAITQFASHEWANLRIGPDRRIEGSADSLSRLASLARIALKWYAIVAFVAAVGLGVGGYVFFSQSPAQEVNWKLPWLALCVLSGMTLPTVAIWSLLEGCNQVANVYLFRFFHGLCNTAVVWAAILLGAGLWAASLMSLAGLVVAGVFLRRRYWTFFKSLMSVKANGPRVSWKNEILPFQWRIAVSWISGYFVFSLFTPVLFHYHGPVIAGQMGMTWSLVSVLSALGSAWISPRVPQLGMLVAQERYAELDRLFWRLTLIVTAITILGALSILSLVVGLNHYQHPLANRLLPPLPTALFLLATIIYTSSGTMAAYLRAHKREPLLFISLLLGVLVGLSTWQLGRFYSALGMAAGYLASFVIVFPLTVIVWRRSRLEWHGHTADSLRLDSKSGAA